LVTVEVVGAAVVLAVVGGTNLLHSGCCCSVVDVEFKVLLDFVLIVAEMADVVPADFVLPICCSELACGCCR
jgi:hypothetical protein